MSDRAATFLALAMLLLMIVILAAITKGSLQ